MTDQAVVSSELPRVVATPAGGLGRSGRVTLRSSTTLVGGVDLDLTEAVVPPSGSRITKISLVGGVNVRVRVAT